MQNEFVLSLLIGTFVQQAPCDALHLMNDGASRQRGQQGGEIEVHLRQRKRQWNLRGKNINVALFCKEAWTSGSITSLLLFRQKADSLNCPSCVLRNMNAWPELQLNGANQDTKSQHHSLHCFQDLWAHTDCWVLGGFFGGGGWDMCL